MLSHPVGFGLRTNRTVGDRRKSLPRSGQCGQTNAAPCRARPPGRAAVAVSTWPEPTQRARDRRHGQETVPYSAPRGAKPSPTGKCRQPNAVPCRARPPGRAVTLRSALRRNQRSKREIGGTVRRPCPTARRRREVRDLSRRCAALSRSERARSTDCHNQCAHWFRLNPLGGNVVKLTLYPVGHGLPAVP